MHFTKACLLVFTNALAVSAALASFALTSEVRSRFMPPMFSSAENSTVSIFSRDYWSLSNDANSSTQES
jgi:hypothetical protein